VITAAVALLGLIAEQEHSRLETRRRLWSKVHELLADGHTDAAALLGEAADAPPIPERRGVLLATGSAEALDDALARLEQDHVLGALVHGELVAAAPPPELTRRARDLAALGLRVGIGESHRAAAQALSRTSENNRVVHWERLVREGLVGVLEPDVASQFARSFLAGLDAEQVATLESFLRHHGSRQKVAQELRVHRNTVRNRLEMIESTLGRSLEDPDARASAWLALQAQIRA
jgi:purine catabolism regulator